MNINNIKYPVRITGLKIVRSLNDYIVKDKQAMTKVLKIFEQIAGKDFEATIEEMPPADKQTTTIKAALSKREEPKETRKQTLPDNID